MRIIACIEDAALIEKILVHLDAKALQLSPPGRRRAGRRPRGRSAETLSFGFPLMRGPLQASAGNRLRARGGTVRIAATANGGFGGRGAGGRDFTHQGWTRGPAPPLCFALD